MEPGFETRGFGDKSDLDQNVSSPFSTMNRECESKFSTEEFLRQETNVSPHKSVNPNEESNVSSSNVADKDNVSAEAGNSKVVHETGDSNSDSCPKLHTMDLPNGQSSDKATAETEIGDHSGGDKFVADNTPKSGHDELTDNDKFKAKENESSEQSNSSDKKVDEEQEDVSEPGSSKQEAEGETTANDVKEPEEHKEEWLDILGSGHLLKKTIKAGEPDTRPNKSDICTISFTGRLEDGTVVEEVENLKIHLNDNEVIQGIDFALALMEKGEEAELKVGPRFAYGSLGRQPSIPAGSTLFYSVTLHDVQEDPPIHTLTAKERLATGLKKKERGNYWYSRDEHSIAITCYRRALEFLDDTDIPDKCQEDDVFKILDERLKTYNNLTASQMKIQAYDAALMSVNQVLISQPKNVKALFRKSKILKEKGDLTEAISAVRQALAIDKGSKSLQQELSALLAAQRKDNSKQRELYKKMMGTSANQDKEDKTKPSRSTYSAIKWTSLFAFAAVIVAGTVALKYKM